MRDVGDEALDDGRRLLVALLLGELREAREVGEGDRDAHVAELDPGRAEVLLHVPDHVALHEVAQEAAVDELHHRLGERQQLRGQLVDLLGDLDAGDAVADSGSCT